MTEHALFVVAWPNLKRQCIVNDAWSMLIACVVNNLNPTGGIVKALLVSVAREETPPIKAWVELGMASF